MTFNHLAPAPLRSLQHSYDCYAYLSASAICKLPPSTPVRSVQFSSHFPQEAVVGLGLDKHTYAHTQAALHWTEQSAQSAAHSVEISESLILDAVHMKTQK